MAIPTNYWDRLKQQQQQQQGAPPPPAPPPGTPAAGAGPHGPTAAGGDTYNPAYVGPSVPGYAPSIDPRSEAYKRQKAIDEYNLAAAKGDPNSLAGAGARAGQQSDTLEFQRTHQQPVAAPTLDPRAYDAVLAAAAGSAPSQAQSLYRQGVDEAQKGALGLAATYSGRNPGMALRTGLTAGTDAVTNAAAGAAALRAKEMADARGQALGAAGKNVDAELAQRGLSEDERKALLAAQLAASGQQVTALGGKATADAASKQAEYQLWGSGASAAAAGLSALSDKRAKKNIKRKSYADALADEVHGVTFEYKPGLGEPAGENFGLLAHEIEKVFPGAVGKRPDGLRELKIPHLTTANTALISELAKRVKTLEARG